MLRRAVPVAVVIAALAGCATRPVPRPQPGSPPAVAPGHGAPAAAGAARPTAAPLAVAGAPIAARGDYAAADLGPALTAFRASCPALLRRADASGLTQPGDWAAPCAAAATAADAHAFFATALTAIAIGDGRGLDTGYYEPDLAAALTAAPGFAVPIYRRPPDLIDLDLGTFDAGLSGKHIRGRIAGTRFVPYYDRGEIDDGALAGRGLELAWAADPYAAFFLEIQGSGRLRLPDGTTLRVGYDGQNGHAYTGIGKLLRDRGALGPGQATMAGIIGWLRAHPAEAPAILRANRSKVFFKRLNLPPDVGPPGALGVPLTPRVSVAADPAFVPLGAPLWLDTTVAGAPFRTIVVAQDTGGAIRGANRLDLFWGSGDAAGAVAGGITATGRVTLLLPAAAAARLLAAKPDAATRPPSDAAAPPRP
jgi:membrane-bound lytic murein transglycosylase A